MVEIWGMLMSWGEPLVLGAPDVEEPPGGIVAQGLGADFASGLLVIRPMPRPSGPQAQ